ncbi:hypothetical protein D3C81_1882630 [compost metagenome]
MARYKDLRTFFTFVICSDGYEISGTSEKTGEIVEDGERIIYNGKSRKRGMVTGHIERNYIFNSVMHLHVTEEGRDRDFSTYISIKINRFSVFRAGYLGRFYSTAADSQGAIVCQRSQFQDHPKAYVKPQVS